MTIYTIGAGQTQFGLVLTPQDTAVVNTGGKVVGTKDGGVVDLRGGRSIGTDIVSGGSADVNFFGSAVGSLVENGGSIVVLSGSLSGTIIDKGGDVLLGAANFGTGTSNATLVNGGIEDLRSTSAATNTAVVNGGLQLLEDTSNTATNTFLASGGQQEVFGTATNTVVGSGGLQDLRGSAALAGTSQNTVVNKGGKQVVSGGVSNGTVINPGGVEDVFASATGTVINGGTMIVETAAATRFPGVTGGIRFTGHGGALELAGPSLTTTTISGFAPSDRIGLLNFGFTSSATATLGANNLLTIQGLTGGTATLMLDPAENYHGDVFRLASDSHGGTNLTVQAAQRTSSVPELASLQSAVTAQGDPLGLRAAFTQAAPAAVSAAGAMLPIPAGGYADAMAALMQAASGQVQIPIGYHGG